MKSILDYHVVQPGYENCGPEPTLRDLIYRYYNSYPDLLDNEKVLELAKEYCKQIEEKEKKNV